MRFQILDVEHGFCAYVEADNNNLMVFDCGHHGVNKFRPSSYFLNRGHRSIESLFVTNYDEDHISDLPNVYANLNIRTLHRNNSISAEGLRRLKLQSGYLSDAMKVLLKMIESYTAAVSTPPEFPNMYWEIFHNNYPDFEDTNNISLVVFLQCRDTTFLIPGDIEKPGWERLLQQERFRQALQRVNYFIASHHGRENGYCRQVFDYCQPSAIIISDGPKIYATQEMVNTYARHARGTQFQGERRYVLTTRTDGTLLWEL
jgi:beta-lactamase superfamily II metal-dependent hydrolase